MKNGIFRVVCVLFILGVLFSFVGCGSKPDMVFEQDIIELYNENQDLFNKTAKEVEAFQQDIATYIEGVYFKYENGLVVAYQYDKQIDIILPDNVYEDIAECFRTMDTIVNDEYDEDDYVLAMSCGEDEELPEGTSVTQFMFSNEKIGLVVALSYSEIKQSEADLIINDNWSIFSWGGV